MLEAALTFFFGFSCGVLALVLGIMWISYRFLGQIEEKKERTSRTAHFSAPILLHKSTAKLFGGYVKVQDQDQSITGPNKNVPWVYMSLKDNSVFIYHDDTMEKLEDIIELDDCIVCVRSNNWGSPQNSIQLVNTEQEIYKSEHVVFLYFSVGQEMEEWYWKLKSAAELTYRAEEIQQKQEKIAGHFEALRRRIFTVEQDTLPESWLNILISRFWWNLFENKSFHRFIVKRLGKRIARITDFPRFIESMVLHSIDLGPQTPYFSNISIANVSNQGSVDIDADLEYMGGFSMTIKIKTSISLPGTSLEIPATAVINVKRISGRVRIHISPPPCERLWIGFHELPDTDINAETQIALLDTDVTLPRIANSIFQKLRGDLTRVVVNKLKSDIVGEKMVLPNMDDFPLPYFTHHDGEEDEDYISQVILSREGVRGEERKRRGPPGLLDISPSGVTILNKKLESDQILPLIKAYATKDGVRKITTTINDYAVRENFEKGKQAILDSGITNPKNWKDPLYSNLGSMKVAMTDGLQTIGVVKQEKDVPPNFQTSKVEKMKKQSDRSIYSSTPQNTKTEKIKKLSSQPPAPSLDKLKRPSIYSSAPRPTKDQLRLKLRKSHQSDKL